MSYFIYMIQESHKANLQWFLVSYLFCLGRIYCHVRLSGMHQLFLHGWLFILNVTFYAALSLPGKKKENIGNAQCRGKIDNTEQRCL